MLNSTHQCEAKELVVQTDGDWAACKSTRRSHSEGWVCRGRHLLHHWCRVQACVALRTGQAELRAQIQGLQEVAEFEVLDGRALAYRVPHAEVCCRSGFNCMQRYHASSRSWSTQAVGSNHVDPQQILEQEGIEVRRISRAVNSAICVAFLNSSQDLCRAVVLMGGMWPGAQLDDCAGFSCGSVVLNEMSLMYPCL